MYVVALPKARCSLIFVNGSESFLVSPGRGRSRRKLGGSSSIRDERPMRSLVNSSRAIIYADKTEAFANVAREAAHAVQKEMAGYLHDKGIIPCKA